MSTEALVYCAFLRLQHLFPILAAIPQKRFHPPITPTLNPFLQYYLHGLHLAQAGDRRAERHPVRLHRVALHDQLQELYHLRVRQLVHHCHRLWRLTYTKHPSRHDSSF